MQTKFTTFELLKKNILIAGFGRIGKKLIKQMFGLLIQKYTVYDPYVDEEIIKKVGGIKGDKN